MSRLPDVSGDLPPELSARLEGMLRRRGGTGSAAYRRLMANPELTRRVSDLGEHLRYSGLLPDDLRETVILAVAAHARCAYVWVTHEDIARAAGVPEPVIAHLRARRRPATEDPVPAAALRVADAVLARRPIPQPDHDAVAAALGVAGVIEVAYLAAFYEMFAAGLIGFEVPLPEGAADPFA